MKQKTLLILSILASLVAVFYTTEFMEAVSNYANQYGEIIRTAGMMLNLSVMMLVFICCIFLVFNRYQKCVTNSQLNS